MGTLFFLFPGRVTEFAFTLGCNEPGRNRDKYSSLYLKDQTFLQKERFPPTLLSSATELLPWNIIVIEESN